MSDDSDFADEPPEEESLNFFAELERLATDEQFKPFAVILMSGHELDVDIFGQLTIYETMYIFHARNGDSVMFPFPNVCAVHLKSESI